VVSHHQVQAEPLTTPLQPRPMPRLAPLSGPESSEQPAVGSPIPSDRRATASDRGATTTPRSPRVPSLPIPAPAPAPAPTISEPGRLVPSAEPPLSARRAEADAAPTMAGVSQGTPRLAPVSGPPPRMMTLPGAMESPRRPMTSPAKADRPDRGPISADAGRDAPEASLAPVKTVAWRVEQGDGTGTVEEGRHTHDQDQPPPSALGEAMGGGTPADTWAVMLQTEALGGTVGGPAATTGAEAGGPVTAELGPKMPEAGSLPQTKTARKPLATTMKPTRRTAGYTSTYQPSYTRAVVSQVIVPDPEEEEVEEEEEGVKPEEEKEGAPALEGDVDDDDVDDDDFGGGIERLEETKGPKVARRAVRVKHRLVPKTPASRSQTGTSPRSPSNKSSPRPVAPPQPNEEL
jgi:hypothetical protein